MVLSDSSRVLRWSRWGVLLASLVMACALVLPTWFAFRGTHDASHIVARGQGQAIVEAIVGRLRATRGRPTEADLNEIYEALTSSGLRYVRLTGRVQLEAGTPTNEGTREYPWRAERDAPTFASVGDRVRMVSNLPPPRREGPRRGNGLGPPPRGEGPPPGGPPPGGRPPRQGPPGGPPSLIVEFDPGPANDLVTRARTSLVINCCVAAGLLIASWFAFLWMRRQERGEVARARERHLATLGEMSAVLAHEIRNPLASLKGHAQLLAESLEGDNEKEAKANRVVHEAIRLETLTTDLLDFVRTGKIHRTQANPADLVNRAAMDVGSDRIVVQTEAAPASFAMDGDRMQQVLVNLLSNGLQASDDGKVYARVEREADRLVFTVTDSGKGIPEERLEDMFAPFHTTKVRGTGLGLAVVRRIVELHGGTVTASNAKDGGAQFRIEIPEVS